MHCLPAFVDRLGLDAEGNIAAALTSRQEALLHSVLDLGNLALTLFILWQVMLVFPLPPGSQLRNANGVP